MVSRVIGLYATEVFVKDEDMVELESLGAVAGHEFRRAGLVHDAFGIDVGGAEGIRAGYEDVEAFAQVVDGTDGVVTGSLKALLAVFFQGRKNILLSHVLWAEFYKDFEDVLDYVA